VVLNKEIQEQIEQLKSNYALGDDIVCSMDGRVYLSHVEYLQKEKATLALKVLELKAELYDLSKGR
jgi:hypothetical protein